MALGSTLSRENGFMLKKQISGFPPPTSHGLRVQMNKVGPVFKAVTSPILVLVAVFLVTSCTPAQHQNKAPTPTQGPASMEEIISEALEGAGSLCYTTKLGSEVRTDGSVPCPAQKEVENIQGDVARANKIHSLQWEKLVLFYTGKVIECGGIVAMGCTQPLMDDNTMSVVSLYYPWRRAILRHELTHVAFIWNKEPEFKHFCLDNPSMCDDKGSIKLKFLGE
jgi:hypothetical protein